ncbi:MAG: hypothetical protein R3C01_06005 [Planctomycetaceae bacterium]
MNTPTAVDWLTAVATAIGAIATVAGVIIAFIQLRNLNSTLSMSVLSAVLQLEAEMNARKEKVDSVASAIRREGIAKSPNERLVEILKDELDGYLENWLNAADRLAYCIKKGYLPERDWRVEYREYFLGLVRDHEQYFGASTIYTNILDLNNRWRRE